MKKLLFIFSALIITFISCKEESTDTTAPVITLNGSPEVYTAKDSTYVDVGATASDDVDGDITSKIVVMNPVDEHTINTYYVTYNVTDNAGNPATEVKRKVIVAIF